MASSLGITPRSENYSEWYNDLVAKANLAEHSSVRGCMVIKPHGYRVWELMQQGLDGMFKETGHSNAYFPLLIPKSYLAKEATHVDGFAKECAVVTHYRLKSDPIQGVVVDPDAKLDEEFIIRPTSETIIWNTYRNWIQSYRDLPLLVNQWANVMRWEMRTRLFLRTSEFLWQEGHTAHATWDEAEAEALTILSIYRRFAEEWMAVPVLVGLKSKGETFAGADHTYCIEALTQDKRAIQAGTSHHLDQNFAKAFDVQFQTAEGTRDFVYATSWGVSTRLIGALIMAHSDDKGFLPPPRLAPVQVVLIPMGRDAETREKTIGAANKLKAELTSLSAWNLPIRVQIDDREKESPGFKFNHWELHGASIRVEMGPRDLESGVVPVSRRDTGEKTSLPLDESLPNAIVDLLSQIQSNLFDLALQFRKENTIRVDTWAEFEKAFKGDDAPGLVLAHWDGTKETEERISEQTKATIRCIPSEPLEPQDALPGQCILTGAPSAGRVVFAKAY